MRKIFSFLLLSMMILSAVNLFADETGGSQTLRWYPSAGEDGVAVEVTVSWKIRAWMSQVIFDFDYSERVIGDTVWFEGKSYTRADVGDVFDKVKPMHTSTQISADLLDNRYRIADGVLGWGVDNKSNGLDYTFRIPNDDLKQPYKDGTLAISNFRIKRLEFSGLYDVRTEAQRLQREAERAVRLEAERIAKEKEEAERRAAEEAEREEREKLAKQEAERKAAEKTEAEKRVASAREEAASERELERKRIDEEKAAEERARKNAESAKIKADYERARAEEEARRRQAEERAWNEFTWEFGSAMSEGDRWLFSLGFYSLPEDSDKRNVRGEEGDFEDTSWYTIYPPEGAFEFRFSSMFEMEIFDADFIGLFFPVSLVFQLNNGEMLKDGKTVTESYSGGKVGISGGMFLEWWFAEALGAAFEINMLMYVQDSVYTFNDDDSDLIGFDFNGAVSLLLPFPVMVSYGKSGDFWGFSIGAYLFSDDMDWDFY